MTAREEEKLKRQHTQLDLRDRNAAKRKSGAVTEERHDEDGKPVQPRIQRAQPRWRYRMQ